MKTIKKSRNKIKKSSSSYSTSLNLLLKPAVFEVNSMLTETETEQTGKWVKAELQLLQNVIQTFVQVQGYWKHQLANELHYNDKNSNYIAKFARMDDPQWKEFEKLDFEILIFIYDFLAAVNLPYHTSITHDWAAMLALLRYFRKTLANGSNWLFYTENRSSSIYTVLREIRARFR